MFIKQSPSRIAFNIINYTFLAVLAVSIILPFVNSFAMSMSGSDALKRGVVTLWPVDFTLVSYRTILLDPLFTITFVNTIFLTVVKTFLLIVISLMGGYALHRDDFKFKKIITFYIMVTMFFGGGLIPSYILISNWLHWSNSYLALIVPGVVSQFLIIFFRNNIANLPKEMAESAEMDGANDFVILFRIILPLILPTVIAFVIFNAVGYWNEWYGCMLYIRDPRKFTLQYKLRQILQSAVVDMNSLKGMAVSMRDMVHPNNIKNAALLVTILPIMLIYPFLQRYFIHGTLAGALKG